MPDEALMAFLQDIRDHCPWVDPLWREHVRDNDEILPHALMGRITGIASGLSEPDLTSLLGLLERGLALASPSVDDVICVSFTENLYGEDALVARIGNLAGPLLKADLARAGLSSE